MIFDNRSRANGKERMIADLDAGLKKKKTSFGWEQNREYAEYVVV